MRDRRSVLRGLAGLSAGLALMKATGVAGHGADVIPALYIEKCRVVDFINAGHCETEAEEDAMMDCWGACDHQAIANPATTLAGALMSIEWAKDELMTFGFNTSEPDQGTRVVLALIDGALSVLRSQGCTA